jgi:hypothetical protein
MIASTSHQAWLFYSPLARQAVLLKDDLLDPVDQLLDDTSLVDFVHQCLAARSPLSIRTGRSGMAPDRLLRCCVMKHLKDWMATADRGYYSAKNEREAQGLRVKKVALPARGRLSEKRAKLQKQRWFRRALRWRAGWEATISTLKNPFSMWRATYKGAPGFQRYAGWCVIAKNLFSLARYQERMRRHGPVR